MQTRFLLTGGLVAVLTVAVFSVSHGLGAGQVLLWVGVAAAAVPVSIVGTTVAARLIPQADDGVQGWFGLGLAAMMGVFVVFVLGLIDGQGSEVRGGLVFGVLFGVINVWIYRRNRTGN